MSQGTAQWEHRLVTISQRALYCDQSQARQSDTNEHTHTYTVSSTPKTFSHAVSGWPEGQLVMGMDPRSPPPVEAPPCSIYSWPCDPGPSTLTTPGKEIAEQCGRSESGQGAQGPALILGRPWAPTPGCPPLHTPFLPVGFPQGGLRRPCSLPSRHPYETQMADHSYPFLRSALPLGVVASGDPLPLGYNSSSEGLKPGFGGDFGQ